VVILLIDNSDSMRGRPITVAAMCGNILSPHSEALRREGRGARLHLPLLADRQERERWVADGKRRNPGRLNDLCTLFTTRPARRGGASARTSA
jgi:cobaltochelatase CobT